MHGQGRRHSFYFRGSSGFFAWLMNTYINRLARIREAVNDLLAVETVAEQQWIYDSRNLSAALWRPFVQWCLRRDLTFAMLGVPCGQRQQLEQGYPGGALQFIVDRVESVFRTLPLHDNYFWRVYLTGEYTPDCCPEYLKPDNFERLKDGQADCIQVNTNTLLGFPYEHQGRVSRKFPAPDHRRHRWLTRSLWPLWFACDNVCLSSDHLPYLQHRFETVALTEDFGKIPYVPFARVPYYVFVGRKGTSA